jgi:hypothetical protein
VKRAVCLTAWPRTGVFVSGVCVCVCVLSAVVCRQEVEQGADPGSSVLFPLPESYSFQNSNSVFTPSS